MLTFVVCDREAVCREEVTVTQLVQLTGEEAFGPALARYLHAMCGADHFTAFRWRSDTLQSVATCCVQPDRTAHDRVNCYVNQGLWRHDPAMAEVQHEAATAKTALIHVDFSDGGYGDLRRAVYPDVRDRVVLRGRYGADAFGLSILRFERQPSFSEEEFDRLRASADVLIALLGKHAQFSSRPRGVSSAFASVADIESRIACPDVLPRRETQVCARILAGLSSTGIAQDLTVSEETVKTYRKRAYLRLGIGSERELLTWYLALWGQRQTGAVGHADRMVHMALH